MMGKIQKGLTEYKDISIMLSIAMATQCVICNQEIVGYGNNPAPLKNEGRCCDACNHLVILKRFHLAFNKNDEANPVKKIN